MNLNFKSVFVSLLFSVLAMLSSGCQMVANATMPSARAASRSPQYKQSARVDFIKDTYLIVRDLRNGKKIGPAYFGQEAWAPIHNRGNGGEVYVAAVVEVHWIDTNNVTQLPFSRSYGQAWGVMYDTKVVGVNGIRDPSN